MRDIDLAEGELYHIFNRGTDKRKIFLKTKDYERFIVNLIFHNTTQIPISNLSRYNIIEAIKNKPENPLVKIHALVLLPNHFHLILEQLEKKGISRLMHRIEMGYAKYFNKQNNRSGNLFQGAYKAIHIGDDPYLNHLPLYIHTNPLKLLATEANWKKVGIKNKKKAWEFLKNYRWSSLPSYLDLHNWSFIEKSYLNQFYETPQEWKDELLNWEWGLSEI